MSAVNAELLHVTAKSTSNRKKRHFRLRNINLAFPAGKLSIIGGAVGCGKTSLLLALLGEMRHTGGHIHIPIQTLDSAGNSSSGGGADMLDGAPRIRDVAYVAQEAWLRAGTIHDNILFGLPYDADRYHAVIRICGLEPDLRVLKGGHFTEVGANGVVLSGGQKQRLALARAVYSRAQILLLDDCLSAVDSHTAKHILNECLTNFESPIIAGRTIVLVTHHINLCLHSAAYVVCMKNGRVTAVGTPDEVLASGKLAAITDLVSNAPSRSGSHEADSSTVTPEATAAVTPSTSTDNAPALGSATAAQDGKLVEEEERGVGALKMDVVKLYVNSARGGAVAWVCIMLSYSVTQFITTLSDYWTRVWVDATDSGVVRPSLYYMCGYAAIALLFFIVKFSQWTLVSKVHIASVRSIHEQLLHRIARATPRFFDQTPSGRVTIRFGKDMTRTDEALADQLTWFVHALCAALGSLFVVAYVTPMFLVLALLIAGAYCYLGYYFLATTRELKRLDAVSNAPILSIFSEMLRGATTIRAFGAQDQLLLESLDHLDALNRPLWFIWATNRWLSIRVICLGSFVSFFAAFLIMFSADALGPGLAGLSLSYALAFSMDAMWAVRIYGLTELNFNFVERIQQYLNIDQEAPAIIKDNRPPASWPHAGRVDVRDLVVEYKPGVPVLHGLTFSTKPGERVGIIGKTGSGKSTSALALLRVVEAAHGSIEIDGIDISTIGLDDLRRSVSIIPQDPVLFNGTVRSNLDPFDEHDDTVLWEALRRSHLVKDPNRVPTSVAVSAVPTAAGGGDGDGGDEAQLAEEDDDVFHDLEEQITENGGNLSLGQRQLVSIARALVRRSRIVILDEASSSIDFKTDELVQDTIRSELAGVSTIFTIAHRLKTIADYDRVMVLDKGQIIEFDKPSKLLATEGSAFRGMCMASGEFELLVNIANGVNITESSY
ncbi:P-loop containing nucleoside triphosphate hydrolase protein [Ramicandelaber brevisporus]|nr:P-loop containing nucleoside triphosphate hydrolase protein [Ramicandelaber brevisporus]